MTLVLVDGEVYEVRRVRRPHDDVMILRGPRRGEQTLVGVYDPWKGSPTRRVLVPHKPCSS